MALKFAGPATRPKGGQKPYDPLAYGAVLVVGVAAVMMLGLSILQNGKADDTSKASVSAGILALITALAIGIERLLEGFWTLVDRLAPNPAWPFSRDAEIISDFAKQL